MRNAFGYILGFLVFVAGIPALMWWVSGRPFPWTPSLLWIVIALILAVAGLALSIWSIVHMKRVGEGNPFDAYNHEVAPRTKHLMTDGPYRCAARRSVSKPISAKSTALTNREFQDIF